MPFLSTPSMIGSRARSPALSLLSTTPAANGSNITSASNSFSSSPISYHTEDDPTNESQSARSPGSWTRERYLSNVERHELIQLGYGSMPMEIINGLDLEDAFDYLPMASLYGGCFIGWRRKSKTWPTRRTKRRRSF